jgi:hypothetical protein
MSIPDAGSTPPRGRFDKVIDKIAHPSHAEGVWQKLAIGSLIALSFGISILVGLGIEYLREKNLKGKQVTKMSGQSSGGAPDGPSDGAGTKLTSTSDSVNSLGTLHLGLRSSAQHVSMPMVKETPQNQAQPVSTDAQDKSTKVNDLTTSRSSSGTSVSLAPPLLDDDLDLRTELLMSKDSSSEALSATAPFPHSMDQGPELREDPEVAELTRKYREAGAAQAAEIEANQSRVGKPPRLAVHEVGLEQFKALEIILDNIDQSDALPAAGTPTAVAAVAADHIESVDVESVHGALRAVDINKISASSRNDKISKIVREEWARLGVKVPTEDVPPVPDVSLLKPNEFLVLIPKGIKLSDFNRNIKYRSDKVDPNKMVVENSYWVAVPEEVLKETEGRSYDEQVAKMNKECPGARVPTIIEAVAVGLIYHERTGKWMLEENTTVCVGKDGKHEADVGHFSDFGLQVFLSVSINPTNALLPLRQIG